LAAGPDRRFDANVFGRETCDFVAFSLLRAISVPAHQCPLQAGRYQSSCPVQRPWEAAANAQCSSGL
jgi:hypothetical protein